MYSYGSCCCCCGVPSCIPCTLTSCSCSRCAVQLFLLDRTGDVTSCLLGSDPPHIWIHTLNNTTIHMKTTACIYMRANECVNKVSTQSHSKSTTMATGVVPSAEQTPLCFSRDTMGTRDNPRAHHRSRSCLAQKSFVRILVWKTTQWQHTSSHYILIMWMYTQLTAVCVATRGTQGSERSRLRLADS